MEYCDILKQMLEIMWDRKCWKATCGPVSAEIHPDMMKTTLKEGTGEIAVSTEVDKMPTEDDFLFMSTSIQPEAK